MLRLVAARRSRNPSCNVEIYSSLLAALSQYVFAQEGSIERFLSISLPRVNHAHHLQSNTPDRKAPIKCAKLRYEDHVALACAWRRAGLISSQKWRKRVSRFWLCLVCSEVSEWIKSRNWKRTLGFWKGAYYDEPATVLTRQVRTIDLEPGVDWMAGEVTRGHLNSGSIGGDVETKPCVTIQQLLQTGRAPEQDERRGGPPKTGHSRKPSF